MFYRNVIETLKKWAQQKDHLPIVLRGARQVGKTTVINEFAKHFEQYIYLNLELPDDRKAFEQFNDINTLIQNLFFIKKKTYSAAKKTLIFIDEIQEVPMALNILRYFYEQAGHLYVIAAGSLLEMLLDKGIRFPVGRVEYLVLYPVSFPEFLNAIGEKTALAQLNHIPLNTFAHDALLRLFHTYSLIGGMPKIVDSYAKNKDLTGLSAIYESLLVSYQEDVEKYAKSAARIPQIQHAMRSAISLAGSRIQYAGFGDSNYGSREMKEALQMLEKALLVKLIYPHKDFKLPLIPDQKKSPRLQFLDTGLMNYFLGIQFDILNTDDLNKIYQGHMIEHLIGQELLATKFNPLHSLHFWVREKKTSMAEIDFLYVYQNKLIPIEVKSGKEGKLKSLHLFMEHAPHKMAIRLYPDQLHISKIELPSQKIYYLLNLPYYLASQLDQYLKWFESEIENV